MADERPPIESFLQREDLEPTPSPEAVLKTLRGTKGDKGNPGKDGVDGKDGIDGKDGKDGAQGIQGIRGERGFRGERGEAGESVEVEEIEAMMLSLLPDVEIQPELSPKEVIEKINKAKTAKIKKERVEGLDELEGLARSANRNVQNFISLGGNRQTKLQLNGAAPLTGVDTINFIGGTLTPVGDGTTANYTPPSSGGGSSGYQAVTGGAVDGSNAVFTWATAPKVIVVDQGRPMQKVSSDGTVNWTGTTTTTLAVAPNFDIFATA